MSGAFESEVLTELDGIWKFACLLVQSMEEPAFIYIGRINPESNTVRYFRTDFGGLAPEVTFGIPEKAYETAMEVLASYSGGFVIRSHETGACAAWGSYVVSIVGWSPEHSKLLALLILYATQNEIQLESITFRYITRIEAFSDLVPMKTYTIQGELDSRSHDVLTHLSPKGKYRHRKLFSSWETPRRSWRFVTDDPLELGIYLSSGFKPRIPVIQDVAYQPAGAVALTAVDSRTDKITVVAIQNWPRLKRL